MLIKYNGNASDVINAVFDGKWFKWISLWEKVIYNLFDVSVIYFQQMQYFLVGNLNSHVLNLCQLLSPFLSKRYLVLYASIFPWSHHSLSEHLQIRECFLSPIYPKACFHQLLVTWLVHERLEFLWVACYIQQLNHERVFLLFCECLPFVSLLLRLFFNVCSKAFWVSKCSLVLRFSDHFHEVRFQIWGSD